MAKVHPVNLVSVFEELPVTVWDILLQYPDARRVFRRLNRGCRDICLAYMWRKALPLISNPLAPGRVPRVSVSAGSDTVAMRICSNLGPVLFPARLPWLHLRSSSFIYSACWIDRLTLHDCHLKEPLRLDHPLKELHLTGVRHPGPGPVVLPAAKHVTIHRGGARTIQVHANTRFLELEGYGSGLTIPDPNNLVSVRLLDLCDLDVAFLADIPSLCLFRCMGLVNAHLLANDWLVYLTPHPRLPTTRAGRHLLVVAGDCEPQPYPRYVLPVFEYVVASLARTRPVRFGTATVHVPTDFVAGFDPEVLPPDKGVFSKDVANRPHLLRFNHGQLRQA